MDSIHNFILDFEGEQAELMLYLHDMMGNYPDVRAKIAYKIPFYYRKSWLCYINPLKDGHVEFAFTRGNELSNEQGILISKGRKQVMGIELKSIDDIPLRSLSETIQEAILLDDIVPYSIKKKP